MSIDNPQRLPNETDSTADAPVGSNSPTSLKRALDVVRGQLAKEQEKRRKAESDAHALRLIVKDRRSLIAARDSAEEANRAKANFLAGMSHEMRTPIGAILGLADLLTERDLDDSAKHYVRRIEANAEALRELTEDILEFARLDAGQLRLNEKVFSPEQVLRDVAERLEERARSRGLELTVSVADGLCPWVVGDGVRVNQIISNLVGNALKFTKRGSIDIRAFSDAHGDPTHVRYEVSDSGIGIAERDQNHIFERFFRGGSTAPGTGLGLSICKHLAELMGGKIEVESELGVGSTFRISVPHGPASDLEVASVRAPISRSSDRGRGAPVLLVEDNNDNRILMRRFLERTGFLVDVAVDGAEAQAKLDGGSYKALVSDLSMPKFDGFQLLSWLRESEKKRGARPLPAIVATAHALAETEERARKAGADEFLTKPLHARELCDAVICVIKRRSNVLIADDAEDSRTLLSHYLNQLEPEVNVHTARNGEEALAVCKGTPIDLILMDVVMDGIGGLETVRRLRELDDYRSTPILGCTAHSEETEHEKCRQAGYTDVLTKPIRKPHLREKVDALLMSHSSSQPSVAANTQARQEVIGVPSDIADLVPGFLQNRAADVLALREAVVRDDWAKVRRCGHGMKGTGGAYGFERISQLGEQLESTALKRDMDEILRLTEELSDYLSQVQWRAEAIRSPDTSE